MKKRFLVMSIALMAAFNVSVNAIPQDDNPPEEGGKGHKVPARHLQVYFDNNTITIVSPYIINNVDIQICDEEGEVIYQETVAEIDYTYIINLTEDEANRAYSIELVYGDQQLYKTLD